MRKILLLAGFLLSLPKFAIAVDMSEINTQPLYHPISHLVYALNSRQVSHVWVSGECLLQQGAFTTLDHAELLRGMADWQKKITQV